MKYRKKPVVIEAFRWLGSPEQTEDPVWIVDAIKNRSIYFEGPKENAFLDNVVMRIRTLEGEMTATVGTIAHAAGRWYM